MCKEVDVAYFEVLFGSFYGAKKNLNQDLRCHNRNQKRESPVKKLEALLR